MEIKAKWLKEDKNIIAPKTLDSQVFDSNGIPISQIIKDIKNSNYHVYSTEEKVVGEWIDGKKIYERVFYIPTLPGKPASEGPSDIYIDNTSIYENLISYNGSIVYSNDIKHCWPLNNSFGLEIIPFVSSDNKLKFRYRDDSSVTHLNLNFIIQYTKNTDTPSLAETALNDE